LEAVFDEMEGVGSVESGHMGGTADNPTYHDVCGGRTGHIEVVQVAFNPEIASFREILEVFFGIPLSTARAMIPAHSIAPSSFITAMPSALRPRA
jgi:peptide methionine sulfoxide reductase MsrA